jgi:hypothetical protein
MGLFDRVDRRIGLAPADDPRRIKVGTRVARVVVPVASTPGARVRIGRAPHRPELQRAVLWCWKRGIAMELAEDGAGLQLDGITVTLAQLRSALD